jgi:lipopolysaccharide biosynthesis regulator YciM
MNIKNESQLLDQKEDSTELYRSRARDVGFDRLMDYFLSQQDPADYQELLYSCHSYIEELIEELDAYICNDCWKYMEKEGSAE